MKSTFLTWFFLIFLFTENLAEKKNTKIMFVIRRISYFLIVLLIHRLEFVHSTHRIGEFSIGNFFYVDLREFLCESEFVLFIKLTKKSFNYSKTNLDVISKQTLLSLKINIFAFFCTQKPRSSWYKRLKKTFLDLFSSGLRQHCQPGDEYQIIRCLKFNLKSYKIYDRDKMSVQFCFSLFLFFFFFFICVDSHKCDKFQSPLCWMSRYASRDKLLHSAFNWLYQLRYI